MRKAPRVAFVASMDLNWAPARVRRNFRIDVASALCTGVYIAVLVTFMPIVVRRMGGSPTDVALVIAAPFIGHLLSPVFTYVFAGLSPVRVVAGTATASRVVFLAGVLVAATPLMLAATTVVTFVIAVANVGAYISLMQGIYPDRERAKAMGNVRIGASLAGIAGAALAGAFIDIIPAGIVFAAAALIALPGAVAVYGMRYEGFAPAPRQPIDEVVRTVWADKRYRRLLLAMTVFGTGNLMNAAMYPILLVDHFQASSSFVGLMTVLQSATMIVAYGVWGRVIDRGSSIRLSLLNAVVTILVPVGFIVAPSTWALLPVAIITGIVNAGGELTFFTNIVQLAPRERIGAYAAAQSLLMGLRGTIAPFLASALLAFVDARAVLLTGILFMTLGARIMAGAVRLAREEQLPVAVGAGTPAD